MLKDFTNTLHRFWCSLVKRGNFRCFLFDLAGIAKFLVLIGTIVLFIYAIFFPSATIIMILLIFFIATLALVEL